MEGARESARWRRICLRAASVCSWSAGLGFGIPDLYGIWHYSTTGQVWVFLGFPTYGGGPFTEIGLNTSSPLLVAFFGVCAAEAVAGWLLWRRRRCGAVLGLALLPFEFAFWIGFALPFGPLLGIARTVLIVTGWPALLDRANRGAASQLT
jgi:hypothetical protein